MNGYFFTHRIGIEEGIVICALLNHTVHLSIEEAREANEAGWSLKKDLPGFLQDCGFAGIVVVEVPIQCYEEIFKIRILK